MLVPFRRRNNFGRRGETAFDRLFDSFFEEVENFFYPSIPAYRGFATDVKETEDAYIIEAELPGVDKKDIEIYYDNNYLTIKARKDERLEEKNENLIRCERYYGELQRNFYVEDIDDEKISATFKNGVLKITLPKREKGRKNRKINIL